MSMSEDCDFLLTHLSVQNDMIAVMIPNISVMNGKNVCSKPSRVYLENNQQLLFRHSYTVYMYLQLEVHKAVAPCFQWNSFGESCTEVHSLGCVLGQFERN